MRRIALTAALLAAGLGAAAIARAELAQTGDLRLSFDGRLQPQKLPRERAAPVSLGLRGSILGVGGSRPPQVRRFSIAVNRYGRISTRGLPACSARELEQTSTREALERCRGMLGGGGRFTARVDLPNAEFPEEGEALAFNGRARGRPVILLHIHGSTPVEASLVLVFRISHPGHGRFGTVFSTTVPKIASDLGYVADMQMTLGRRYRFRGRRRSFLIARCAAPPGFPSTIFTLARARFAFADGRRLTTALTRACRVR